MTPPQPPISSTPPLPADPVNPAVNPVDQPSPAPQPPTVPPAQAAQTPEVATASSIQPVAAQPQTPQSPQANNSSPVTPSEKKQSSGIVSFFVTIVAALIITQLVNLFFFQSYRVLGSSMEPTMQDGDRLIISKIGKTQSKISGDVFQPKRADIIVFTSPRDPSMQLIKRVIGLPGERVVLKNGVFTVYNKDFPQGFNPDELEEYGETLPETTGQVDVVVPENHVFVSGDNRIGSNSLDSRNELGTIPEENIVGITALRLWPLQTARFF